MSFQKKSVQKIVVEVDGKDYTFDSDEQANAFIKNEAIAKFLAQVFGSDNVSPGHVVAAVQHIDKLIEDLGFAKKNAASEPGRFYDGSAIVDEGYEDPRPKDRFRPHLEERYTLGGAPKPAPVPFPSLYGDGDFTLFSDMPAEGPPLGLAAPPPMPQPFVPKAAARKAK